MIWLFVILLPLLAGIAGALVPVGKRGTGWLYLAATLPALWLGLVETSGVSAQWFLLEAHFDLDTPRRILLLLTALLWATAGLYAGSYLREDSRRKEFSLYFGGAMAGNFGLLITGEVAAFYTFFALMTFASFGLVIHSRTKAARRAAKIYLIMAIIGELFLITSLYLAVQSAGSMLLADLPPAVAESPRGILIFVLGLIGFGVKVGAIPLYFWLPLAHPVAPTPASAVLSGAMIKAGLVGWMHLAPVGLVEWHGVGLVMVFFGITAALGAVIIGLAQIDPKTNLAYSSISQMGLMTALLGAGLYGGIPAALLLPALALYAFNHGTAKALLFLGTALPAKVGGAWRILMWTGLVIGVLAIAGGPLTGGLWTKYFLKTFLEEAALPGLDILLALLTVSAIATTVLLTRFLLLLKKVPSPQTTKAPGYLFPWAILLLAGGWWTMSPILLPIDLVDHITGEKSLGILYFGMATNVVAAFPIFLGVLIIALTAKFPSLNYWPTKRPLIPAGDFLVVILWLGAIGSKLLNRLLAKLEGWTKSVRSPEQILYQIIDDKRTVGITAAAENFLRRWDVVGLSFLAIFMTLFLFLR